MTQPTHSEIQAVDPVLTNMLVAYQQTQDRFIAGKIFPAVPIEKQSGTYYIFTKKYWFSDEMIARVPGGKYARSGYGVSTAACLAQLWGLEHPIADEARANNQMPLSLEQAGTQWLAQKDLLRKEIAFSADFMTTGVWGTDNTTATDWDSFTDSDPVNDVLTARRTVSNNTGMDANTMALGYIVHQALVNHPDIVDRVKYVQAATLATVESALAACFGVANYWVGKASYNTANEGQTFSASAIVDDDCLVCCCDMAGAGIMTPNCGYTFTWDGGGGNGKIFSYRDDTIDSDVLKAKSAWDQKVVATDMAYFFSDIV